MGALIGSGRTADVFALDDGWVLRRYRDGTDASEEADVMAYLWEQGYPVPRIRADGARGTSDLVMRRLTGLTLAEAAMAGAVSPAEAGAMIGTLLRRLHALPARSPGAPPEHRVLHLDLHPENVLLTPDGPVVIDWATAEEGPPGLDRAMSALILAEVAVAPGPASTNCRTALAALLTETGAEDYLTEAWGRRAGNPTLGPEEVDRLGAAVELVRGMV
ncbi:phosphotransferase [Streptomyces sp. NPDC018029]|uniref:phosphotransferase n=1 Tax=Streptomyces sp. NPDC018029 TaxID=3365032 RepID=UPI0037B66929